MQVKTVQKNIRMSPRKVRIVANSIKKLTPKKAVAMLPHIEKRAAKPVEKAIKTAMANAVQKGIDPETLIFKEIQINEGPTYKRGMPVSRGRWHPILKRTSHIRIVLEAKKPAKKKGAKKKK